MPTRIQKLQKLWKSTDQTNFTYWWIKESKSMPASSTLARPLTRLTIKLVQKLRNIRVSQQIVTSVEDCLRNRTQAVVVDGHSSSLCQATSGVPQGSVVGPILFRIYIDDLPNAVKSKVRLFADHTVISTLSTTNSNFSTTWSTGGVGKGLEDGVLSYQMWTY